MTDDTQPDAMDLADWLEAVGGGPSAKRCAALLREQHTRITELESQLAQRFDAADMATAAPGGAAEPAAIVKWQLGGSLVAHLVGDVAEGDLLYKGAPPQQDEPVGEVVSASCDHATVRWLHQTSSVGGGDPRNSRAWPKVSGVSRDEGHSRALLVFFAAEPTDDEMRAVHDTLAASPTPPAEQQASATEVALVGAYARLPDFDSSDEPIWEAVFEWKAANPGSDASKKAMAVEGAIIKSLRDFADRTHALRMQAAPKAAPVELSADSLRHQNKLLAETLGACILASGIVRKDIDGFTGPELLHFGEDLRSMLEVAPKQEDAARLDWLEQNLFHREKDEWDTKFGGYKEYNMWVLFSPKGIQGSARDIIDAAREQGADHDR